MTDTTNTRASTWATYSNPVGFIADCFEQGHILAHPVSGDELALIRAGVERDD